MELNQDIIPQIWLSIRPGLGERAVGREEGGGRRGMINQKIESCCLKPGGELNISLPVSHRTQRHLSVGCETLLASLASLAWS